MRNHSSDDNRSLKTFFIFTGFVGFLIIISLAVKAFLIIQQNRFDGEHQFVLSIAQDSKVKKLIVFRPQEHSLTQVTIKNNVKLDGLSQTIGIIPDAYVDTSVDLASQAINGELKTIMGNYYTLKTNLTIFDVWRLLWESQKTINNQTVKALALVDDQRRNDKSVSDIFTDDKVFADNISIQIINASNIPGVANRLERELSNLGFNIISVTTSRDPSDVSKIRYFGNESYTLTKLKRLLNLPKEQVDKELLAKI
ncbi:MAG TPA: LytR C-terminal domain-containing protein, partial [Patescibacteria group bacterium]